MPEVPKIRVVGDPVLHTPAALVTEFDEPLGKLIGDMFAALAAAGGVGLAAPQVGVGLAVFVYDCPDETGTHQIGHLVNPTITTSGDQVTTDEGCLSVPGPYHELPRADQATARGFDRTGAEIEVSGTGFFARCLQHETEHLQGILYIDHLPRNRRRRILRDMVPFEWNAQ
jgi:peptide deformylase